MLIISNVYECNNLLLCFHDRRTYYFRSHIIATQVDRVKWKIGQPQPFSV